MIGSDSRDKRGVASWKEREERKSGANLRDKVSAASSKFRSEMGQTERGQRGSLFANDTSKTFHLPLPHRRREQKFRRDSQHENSRESKGVGRANPKGYRETPSRDDKERKLSRTIS